MNPDFWIKKWQEGETRFHQSKYHHFLEAYGSRFSRGTILVPLCGKSLDMLYLVSEGHSVIGVELSPIACRDFFKEAGILFSEKRVKDFIVFESEKIVLWCGDFFQLPEAVWAQVTGIYDRAALVALPFEVRQKYVGEMSSRTKKGVELLLITFEYLPDAFSGPPFSVSEEEIKKLYEKFSIQKIHSEKEEKTSKNHPKFQSIELIETVYWLKRS